MSKIDELIEKICPNGVRYEELRNKKLFKFYYGKGNKIPEDNGGIYNVYGANGVVSHIDEYNCEDISIIGHIGAVGMVNRCKEKCFVTYNGTIAEVVDKSKVNSQYLYYVLTTLDLPSYKKGSQPFLSVSDFDKISIPVPPLEVQCEIVHILDDFTELSAELSAELKARKKQYKFYLHRLLEVKEGVEITIGEIYDFKYGTGNTIPSEGGKYPVYGSNGKVGYCKEYNSEDAPVIGHIGAYAGIVNWVEGKHFVTYNGVICKYKNKMVNKRYAYYLLLTQDFIGEQKGAQPFVSYDALRKPVVRIPNIEIQKSIVEKLDKLDKLCNDISEGLPAEIEARQKQYEYYRDKLLTFKELKVNE